jgi:glycosyltransferase involved in cell wall biosynthesis
MVTPRYIPYAGGVESHVHEVARRLARQGLEVTVLTTDPSGQLPCEETREDVNIRRVRAWPAQRDYYFAPEMSSIIKKGAWDVIHVQSYHTLVAPLAMWTSWRARLPYVVTFHGGGHSSRMRNALRGVQWALLQPLLARAARLIAIAEFELDFWGARGLPADRFVVIPNGADLPAPRSGMPVVTQPGTRIASIGRLEQYKGHQRLLAALPAIVAQRPDVQLWIAGVGPYEAELRRLAQALHVEDHVEIRAVPASERSRMAEELARTDLVVLLSEFETQPVAILEALALRRPVLVAATSGLQELADKGWACSIPLASSPQQIATAVLEQLDHPLIPPEFAIPTWDECARHLHALYREVAQNAAYAA